jgi:hypothetical protein
MSTDLSFSISEDIFAKMLHSKKEMGYENSSWDDWFNSLLNTESGGKKNEIEKVMEKLHYDQWYETWVKNFALNLKNIWEESSAKNLRSKKSNDEITKDSAIVIARGPSLNKHNHLELLANSNYGGSIICCDGALINALKSGVTPEKFPKYYVATIDAGESIKKFYDDPLVDKFGKKIHGVFSTLSHPLTVDRARRAGIKINWLHTLFDYGEGKKSFNQISALMVRAKNSINGLPGIQTGGNIGTSSWFIGWQILKCQVIALIGIDHSWSENDPWEKIISHGYDHPNDVVIDQDSPISKRLFPKIYNPFFNCSCILDPIFQYYSSALKEFISRSPSWLTTINATEGGCIFGDRIQCVTLKQFLKDYKT